MKRFRAYDIHGRLSLSFPVALILLFFTNVFTFTAHTATLSLKPMGEPRSLEGPILGASTTAFYERLLEDPVKIAVLKNNKAI